MIWRDNDWDVLQILDFANNLAGRKIRQEGFQGLAEEMRLCGYMPA